MAALPSRPLGTSYPKRLQPRPGQRAGGCKGQRHTQAAAARQAQRHAVAHGILVGGKGVAESQVRGQLTANSTHGHSKSADLMLTGCPEQAGVRLHLQIDHGWRRFKSISQRANVGQRVWRHRRLGRRAGGHQHALAVGLAIRVAAQLGLHLHCRQS